MAKKILWIHHIKKNGSWKKNDNKDGVALYKLMNYVVFGKTMEKWRNRINVKLVRNTKVYLKWASKLSYMSHKTFEKDLFVIHKK